MNIPVETKPAIWGVVGGAVILAIVGFTWGGWVTGATAEARATQRADSAVVAALAPVCADRFKHAANAESNLTELKKIDSWSQGDYVEKGGWASSPGSPASSAVTAVAKACATLLVG